MNTPRESQRSGVVLVDKPQGMSSAQVVAAVKRKLPGVKKVGHAGTLDPNATGLLVCLINRATRLAQYAEQGRKIYTGIFHFGTVTDSDDITGEILEQREAAPTLEQVRLLLPEFTGEIDQFPPKISAVKVDGKRAYKLTRAGKAPELSSRQVTVFEFTVEPTEQPEQFTFRVVCSKGTYIRSLARDLGERLGCGGCLGELCREESFPFSLDDAVSLDEVSAQTVMPWSMLFPDVPQLGVPRVAAERLLGGDEAMLRTVTGSLQGAERLSSLLMFSEQGKSEPLGLLTRHGSKWKFAVNVEQ